MSYTKSTVTSRNRARTPLGTAAGDSETSLAQSFRGALAATARRATSLTSAPRALLRRRAESDPPADAKRARKEPRTVHAGAPGGECVRRSRELTAQCGAVAERAHALLERAGERGERLQATLRASLERTPRGSLSPQQSSAAAATPSPRAGRWSGMFGTPRPPTAPPPTPARARESAETTATTGTTGTIGTAGTIGTIGTAGTIGTVGTTGTTGTAGAWVRRLLSRSPDVSVGRSDHERPAGNASDATTPVREVSPRRSRKSVAFKDPNGDERRTPPHALEEARASTVYPAAPPPSAVKEKEITRRSAEPLGDVGRRLGSVENESNSENGGDDLAEESSEDEEAEMTVAEIIREYPRHRAYHILTKTSLVEYAKEHRITLSLKSTKKELFDVARRLATSNGQSR